MTIPIQTTIYIELAVTVAGTYQPGYPETGPSYSSGGDPAEPDSIEDLTITDIRLGDRSLLTPGTQLIDNLTDVLFDEAVNALLEEISE